MPRDFECDLAGLITGFHDKRPSPLLTDGYKFSMSQAGFPLRQESFVLSFRRSGSWVVPLDLAEIVYGMLPDVDSLTIKQRGFLDAFGYGLNPAMEAAMRGEVELDYLPAGTVFGPREPILTITGPSFLVSWLEPLVIMLNHHIQLITSILRGENSGIMHVRCQDEADIVALCWDRAEQMKKGWPGRWTKMAPRPERVAVIKSYSTPTAIGFPDSVFSELVEVLGTNEDEPGVQPEDRIFEVGLRAACCAQHHDTVLQILKRSGLRSTSNVLGAWKHNLYPVGTTGHEHQQRWGSDLAGFMAIRDMRPEIPSYLFDTWDPESGIIQVDEAHRQMPDRQITVRLDSGDQRSQLMNLVEDAERTGGAPPVYILEDGYDVERTRAMEGLRRELGLPASRVWYGYGSYMVEDHVICTRNEVSAAYKLSCTGGRSTMKVSGSGGKQSLPGRPVVFRRLRANPMKGPVDIIGQAGEPYPDGYEVLSTVHGYEPEPHLAPSDFFDPTRHADFEIVSMSLSSPSPIEMSEGTMGLVGRIAMDH